MTPCPTEIESARLLTQPAAEPARTASTDSENTLPFRLPENHRLVPLLVWAAVILTLAIIPFKVLSLGYLPFDDALRHAAKAFSGRDWSDIIVLQDQFKVDHNPGWHWVLGMVHRLTGAGPDLLVTFEVGSLILLFSIAPLGWIKRPEAWVSSLLLGMVIFPGMLLRFYLARPFVFTVFVTLAILLLWRKPGKPSPLLLAVSTILFGLAAWIHGSWYLFALVVAAFGLAGQWRSCFSLAGCWVVGSFLGGLLTGHPLDFLWNAINIGINCFGQHSLQRMLVAEFQPNDGAPLVILLAAAMLILRGVSGKWTWTAVNNPIFILFVLGWVLGFRVSRFWEDWGLPALTLWIALEIQEHLNQNLAAESLRRLAVTLGLCAGFFFCVTGDLRGRWTNLLTAEYLTEENAEMKEWLPEDGGILYSSDMRVFYKTFFKNPHAKWKYALGFEPAFMPKEDLQIYRNIQWNYYGAKAHEPWVAKMRPADRLVISSTSAAAPALPALEWKHVTGDAWIGRLPRAGAADATATSPAETAPAPEN